MTAPNVPMGPNDFPQQRLYVIQQLPARPESLELTHLDYEADHFFDGIPKVPTQKSIYLCQVEWAWSPMHSRLDCYFIHKGKSHWLFWFGHFVDEDPHNWHWEYYPAIATPHTGVSQAQAAVYLLSEFWRSQLSWFELEQFHWINGQGFLSVSHTQAIADLVWQEEEEEEEEN